MLPSIYCRCAGYRDNWRARRGDWDEEKHKNAKKGQLHFKLNRNDEKCTTNRDDEGYKVYLKNVGMCGLFATSSVS